MSYTLTKTNGNILTTVNEASLNVTTSLTFVGRNYSGYGSVIDQNFVYLLENFCNSVEPANSIHGQLWFDSASNQLNVNYDGSNFKGLAYLSTSNVQPTSLNVGDLWWNGAQLAICDGTTYDTIIGPPSDAQSWKYDIANYSPASLLYNTNPTPVMVVASNVTIGFSANTFATLNSIPLLVPNPTTDLANANFSGGIAQGITLAGTDLNGSSIASGNYFWGTASEALSSNSKILAASDDNNYYVTFASDTTGNLPLNSTSTFYFNPSTNVLNATATAARYADLAERYAADTSYEVGTVVIIGGEKEITTTNIVGDIAVAGVISQNPAYMMNSDAGTDQSHPYVALKGRVLCKVTGLIKKGSSLVTSSKSGYAQQFSGTEHARAIFAVSLQDFEGEQGLIEVKI
jgi:hypothetical protein